MIVGGLDTGTHTGCVIMDTNRAAVLYKGVLEAPPAKKATKTKKAVVGLEGIARAGHIAGLMVDVIEEYQPELFVIENYGFGNKHTLATLVEIGTVLRYFLVQLGIPVFLCSPNSLKVYACGPGKGHAKKDMVRLEVFKKWKFEHESDDVIDAYVLARIAVAKAGFSESPHEYQRAQLKNVTPMK